MIILIVIRKNYIKILIFIKLLSININILDSKILDRPDKPINSTDAISLDFAVDLVKLNITNSDELLEIVEFFDDTKIKEIKKIIYIMMGNLVNILKG
jgi:hypothetical protein